MAVKEDDAVIAERSSMHDMLQTLSADEWDHASLCAGWRVRDVATHVHLALTINLFRLAAGLVVNRGDFNRFMATYVPRLGSRPTGQILASWAEVATSARIPPTTKKVEIALDCFVHHHDICLPLGRDVPADPDRLRWMADGMVAARKPIGSGSQVEGFRLIATDIDWHYGSGPEIQGPVVALILAGCGRTVWSDRLQGDGVAELDRRA